MKDEGTSPFLGEKNTPGRAQLLIHLKLSHLRNNQERLGKVRNSQLFPAGQAGGEVLQVDGQSCLHTATSNYYGLALQDTLKKII